MPYSRALLGYALGFVGVVIFGATLPVTRLAVEWLDPWFVTAARAMFAGLLAAAILLVLRRRFPARHLGTLLMIAVFVVFGFPLTMALAMQLVPAAHGGVVLGILPLATAASATLIAGERPSPAFWMWSAIGAAIVVVFALRDSGLTFEIGDLLLLAATVCAAIGYTVSARLARIMPGWEVISWVVVLSLPVTIVATWWLWPAHTAAVPIDAWVALGYLAAFSQFLGFFAWNVGLAIGGISRVGQVQLLQTFVTLIIAALLLGEHIDLATILFAVAVVAVVAMGGRARVGMRNETGTA
ncbi:DMT family transporter [Microbaculum marinisediminis]|uniref:DMT family transporter n=1 Tax=Microbaculum marinisediminis TaxID=2931392 RepID=A0AAW5QX72_9HYPH|nr:DMT family transporter [Microbaculum sp. A6E488]MCT8972555.1 DMT family transporter [Microbaculum sp. A6E488]